MKTYRNVLCAAGALLGASPLSLWAQADAAAAPAAAASATANHSQEFLYLLVATALVLVFLAIVLALGVLVTMNFYMQEKTGKGFLPSFSGLSMGVGNLWAYVAGLRTNQKTVTDSPLDHEYDGIIELDNAAPPLFNYILYGTILFAVGYLTYYHLLEAGELQLAEYNTEVRIADAAKAERAKLTANNVDEKTVVVLTDAVALNDGKSIYMSNCAACHGDQGEGKVGPNLTDNYWLHGGSINDVFKTIKYGVPAKGMISWQSQMNPQKMQQVASYIMTLAGTKPANPKAPEGEPYTASESVTAPADTTGSAGAVPARQTALR